MSSLWSRYPFQLQPSPNIKLSRRWPSLNWAIALSLVPGHGRGLGRLPLFLQLPSLRQPPARRSFWRNSSHLAGPLLQVACIWQCISKVLQMQISKAANAVHTIIGSAQSHSRIQIQHPLQMEEPAALQAAPIPRNMPQYQKAQVWCAKSSLLNFVRIDATVPLIWCFTDRESRMYKAPLNLPMRLLVSNTP